MPATIPQPDLPWILCLETATEVSSVALFQGAVLKGLAEYRQEKYHARLITRLISEVLTNLDLQPSDLSAVAVTRGPGSYTGLRVGVSAAKGLCMARNLPLLAVGSLDALAHQVRDTAAALQARIIPMIDARRMEVYAAVYAADGSALTEPFAQVVEPGSFADWLDAGTVIFAGDGAAKCRDTLRHPNAVWLPAVLASAAGMGLPVWNAWQERKFEDLVTFEPFYLKDFVATQPRKII